MSNQVNSQLTAIFNFPSLRMWLEYNNCLSQCFLSDLPKRTDSREFCFNGMSSTTNIK